MKLMKISRTIMLLQTYVKEEIYLIDFHRMEISVKIKQDKYLDKSYMQ